MRRGIGSLGAQLILLLLLTSCRTVVEETPYAQLENGLLYADGTTSTKQVLEFCTGPITPMYKGELNFYEGDLYSLSNYRELLLLNGFTEITCNKSSTLLDSLLSNGEESVRLIYQSTGAIRIIHEKTNGIAHILLEGMT